MVCKNQLHICRIFIIIFNLPYKRKYLIFKYFTGVMFFVDFCTCIILGIQYVFAIP